MQKQKSEQFTSAAAARGQTQRAVIPKVRYHPTIQAPGDGTQAKTRTRQTQKASAAAGRPPQAGTGDQSDQENHQAGPAPVRPRPHGGKQRQRCQNPSKKPDQKQVQRAAEDPEQASDSESRAEQVPLGDQLDGCDVQEVEVLTRGQRNNPDWFTWRRNRITASVAHNILHCRFVSGRSQTPPTSYLAAVTGRPHCRPPGTLTVEVFVNQHTFLFTDGAVIVFSFIKIHLMFVEMFQSEPKWRTNKLLTHEHIRTEAC